jgi:flagellar basal-body rod modification protein FlgD
METAIAPSISEILSPRATAATAKRGKQQLGQEDFMQLMVTQLKNQDPFKPLEPEQFLGQLAQFSTVNGIESMRNSLSGLSASLQGSQVLQGATLVGRSVLAAGQIAQLSDTGTISGALGVPAGAGNAQVRVIDAGGGLVRTFSVPANGDLTEFSWDGLDSGGARMPAGQYQLEAVAAVGGRQESVEMLLRQRVDSVTIDPAGGALRLNTAGGAIALGDVRRIM